MTHNTYYPDLSKETQEAYFLSRGYSANPTPFELHRGLDCDGYTCPYCKEEADDDESISP